ncbi:MAG: Clp protease N-terminal domain-containing protein, partial [Gaiellaceae bacterium]
RPAERYLSAGADEARHLRSSFIGTEHVLLALLQSETRSIRLLLARFGVDSVAVEGALACWLPGPGGSKIDAEALATLGIDFDAVRAQLEQTFGPGALERSRASCLGIAPRLKLALAYALDDAADRPLRDDHVLAGLLTVRESAAARALATLGVSLESVRALDAPESPA